MEFLPIVFITAVFIFIFGIRIVRPTHRGLIERLGKYQRFANMGFNWIIPIIENIYLVNITEQMIDAEPQEIIANDNLKGNVPLFFEIVQKRRQIFSFIERRNDNAE